MGLEKLIRAFLRGRDRAYLMRVVRLRAFAVVIAGSLLAGSMADAEVPIELSDIVHGTGGFVINGIDVDDFSGWSVSGAGDVNGDGLDDVIIGAHGAKSGGNDSPGESYVVFGKTSGGAVELSAIVSGSGGFVIKGIDALDNSGWSVSGAGDVNGDGLDDLIVGARGRNTFAGASYVVFGKTSGSPVSLEMVSTGTFSGGFVIIGIDAYDRSGHSVSGAGDVNGDGLDDVIIGTSMYDSSTGESYVVFGKVSNTPVELSAVAAGTGGFVINGIDAYDKAGFSVSGAGDVNEDGLDDLVIGVHGTATGESDVVFGKTSGATVELSTIAAGTGGFVVNGVTSGDRSGWSVSGAGDVNGDGLDDLIVGARGRNAFAGASYVVFGKTSGSAVSLETVSTGSGGFVIIGIDAYDRSGHSVSGAGDVNGDGLDDVIIGTSMDDSSTGESYVVFGKVSNTPVELSAVAAGTGGFVINGIDAYDKAGFSVSGAGDVNGDGFGDLIIGAYGADSSSGESYVVFGSKSESLRIGVRDAMSGEPIMNASLYAERSDAPLGFEASFSGVDGSGDAVFSTATADVIEWSVVATAPGYLPSYPILVRQDASGDSVASIGLELDADLDFSNTVRVTIDLQNGGGTSTGLLLLTDTVVLKQSGVNLGIDSIYGLGEMIFLGVPSGMIDISIPDTADFDFGTNSVMLEMDESVVVVLTATLVEPPAVLPRGDSPGSIVGTVVNSDTPPGTLLNNAIILSEQESSDTGLYTYAMSNGDGVYFFPDIVPGTGYVEAFSENGDIRGTSKTVDVTTGATFGDCDCEDEDTELSVMLGIGDPLKVWVNFATTEDGDGSFDSPFGLLVDGVEEVATGGIVNIKGDTGVNFTPGALTLDKAVVIEAINGVIRIGDSS